MSEMSAEKKKDKRIEELERTVKALRAEKEVMDRHIHEFESENEQLKKKLQEYDVTFALSLFWKEKYKTFSNELKSWKELTGCPSPSSAKVLIDSMYTPLRESYLAMKKELDQEIDKWQEATSCARPESVKSKIYGLERECRVWHDTADHQLEQIHGLEDDISDLYDKIKELESNIDEWQKATGCDSPKKAEYKIAVFYDRIDKMKEAASIAFNWMEKIVEG